MSDQTRSRVRTEYGVVEAARVDGLHLFRDVPYAAPPFGRRRFRAPEPPEPWDGVRDATRPGPAAPQPAPADALGRLTQPPTQGEDCLTLEVATPDPGATALPVLVHIHGGAYLGGSGSGRLYRGESFARDGIVHVGINYRLGVDGFLHLDDAADNRGLRDQIAALEWVQRNIAAFGGDPGRVTILGQSAGGVSVVSHLTMPASRGLFAHAVSMSGSTIGSTDAASAAAVTRRLARAVRRAPTAASLADLPLDATVSAAQKIMVWFAMGALRADPRVLEVTPFRPVHGTETLPGPASELASAQPPVPVLAGTVLDEAVLFLAALRAAPGPLGALAARGVGRALRLDDGLRAAYREERGAAPGPELTAAAWGDYAFTMPTVRMLEDRPGPSWLYSFRWQPEVTPRLGAWHGVDALFLRDDLELGAELGEEGRKLFGAHPPQSLATEFHAAVSRFVVEGDPGWEPFDPASRTTMMFDAESAPVPDPMRRVREAWEARG